MYRKKDKLLVVDPARKFYEELVAFLSVSLQLQSSETGLSCAGNAKAGADQCAGVEAAAEALKDLGVLPQRSGNLDNFEYLWQEQGQIDIFVDAPNDQVLGLSDGFCLRVLTERQIDYGDSLELIGRRRPDALMDLGTTLGCWIEPDNPEPLRRFMVGSTTLLGSLSRCEIAERYRQTAGGEVSNMLYYDVFGVFKVVVIDRQITLPCDRLAIDKLRCRKIEVAFMRPTANEWPLVSCIMPTYNRRQFVPSALRYFLSQDYPNKELVIVDDGTDAVGDLLPADPQGRYIRLPSGQTIGAKRNFACEESSGLLIAHWDDDDWHAPRRLRCQVESLLQAKAEICGLKTLLSCNTRTDQSWRYTYPDGQRAWLSGSSLLYTRALWIDRRFPEINVGEDA